MNVEAIGLLRKSVIYTFSSSPQTKIWIMGQVCLHVLLYKKDPNPRASLIPCVCSNYTSKACIYCTGTCVPAWSWMTRATTFKLALCIGCDPILRHRLKNTYVNEQHGSRWERTVPFRQN